MKIIATVRVDRHTGYPDQSHCWKIQVPCLQVCDIVWLIRKAACLNRSEVVRGVFVLFHVLIISTGNLYQIPYRYFCKTKSAKDQKSDGNN